MGVISEKELIDELNKFRSVLTDYDFSEISNIVFFNIESLYIYMKTFKENPLEKQYNELEKILKVLTPYIPTSLSKDALEILSKVLYEKFHDSNLVKDNIMLNIKLDFIEKVKTIRNEREWNLLIEEFKQIRKEKFLIHR